MPLQYNIKTKLNKFFIKVPVVEPSTITTVYIRKGIGLPPETNDNFFLLWEDGSNFAQWTKFNSGVLSLVDDNGDTVILKDLNCDPNGGLALLKEPTSYVKIMARTRRDVYDTCYMNRWGIVNDTGNGYGPAFSYPGSIVIDVRTNYNGSVGAIQSLSLSYNTWYYSEFYTNTNNEYVHDAYDFNTMTLLASTSLLTAEFVVGTTIYIFGGKPYYVDDLYVIRYIDLPYTITELEPGTLWKIEISNITTTRYENLYFDFPASTFGVTSDTDIYFPTLNYSFLLYSPTGTQDVYYYNGTSFVSLGKTRDQLTDTDFYTYGSYDGRCEANKAAYEALTQTSLDILVYDPLNLYNNLELRKIPVENSIVQTDGIDLTGYLSIQSMEFVTSGTGIVKCLLSPDGTNWYTYDFTTSQWVLYVSNPDPNDITLASNIINDGLDSINLQSIPPRDYSTLFGNPPNPVYFMFSFQYNTETDNIEVISVTLYVDSGSDYEIVSNPNDVSVVENINVINVTVNTAGYYIVNYLD